MKNSFPGTSHSCYAPKYETAFFYTIYNCKYKLIIWLIPVIASNTLFASTFAGS